MPTASPSQEEIKRALGPMPKDGSPWSFAQDSQWTQWIEDLTEKETTDLVAAGLHKPSVRRLRAALRESQGRLVLRERALEMMVACAIAQVNLVFLGPPGTAKSLLVRTFAETLGVRNAARPISQEGAAIDEASGRVQGVARDRRYFEYLLTRYTTPEEIFGGVDIKVLLDGNVYARRTVGMLPQAEVAFLDEIFKANSAILNTLLSLTNERIFFNLGQAFRVNLVFVVGASNESPDQNELGALFDRFPIRVACHSVPDDKIPDVLASAERFAAAKIFGQRGDAIPQLACLNDVRLLTKVASCESFRGADGDFQDQFVQLFLRLRAEYGVSDRTPAQILRVSRALALLDADPDAQAPALGANHLRAWGYIAPQFKEAAVLQRFVQDFISRLPGGEPNSFA